MKHVDTVAHEGSHIAKLQYIVLTQLQTPECVRL